MENTRPSSWAKEFLSVLDSSPRYQSTNTGAVADLKERLNREEEIPSNNPSVNLLLQSITHLGSLESPPHWRWQTWVPGSPSWWPPASCGRKCHPELSSKQMKKEPDLAAWWLKCSAPQRGNTRTVGSPGRELNPGLQGLRQRLWLLSWCYSFIHQCFRKQSCPCLSQQAMFTEHYWHSRYTYGMGPRWVMHYSASVLDLSRV